MIKFDQLIEYSKINIFLQPEAGGLMRQGVVQAYSCFLNVLYEVKVSALQLIFKIF